jgi:hypothetical protein
MGYMRRLFASRPFLDLVPDQAVLAGPAQTGGAHIRAARDRDGRTLIAYTPYGHDVPLWLGMMQGEEATAHWFNPRTAEVESIGTFDATGARTFDPPGAPSRGNDWVLVVDAAAADFSAPGAVE